MDRKEEGKYFYWKIFIDKSAQTELPHITIGSFRSETSRNGRKFSGLRYLRILTLLTK